MLIKLLILFCISLTSINANNKEKKESTYVDLGVHGKTYEIEEESLMETIRNNFKSFNPVIARENLKKDFVKSVSTDLKFDICSKAKKRSFRPLILIEQDIIEPITKQVLRKKGEFVNVLTEFKPYIDKHLLFIDETDEIQKSLAYMYANRADVYIVKGNHIALKELGVNAQTMQDKRTLEMFGLNCVPSFYTVQNDGFIINEINPQDLIGESQ